MLYDLKLWHFSESKKKNTFNRQSTALNFKKELQAKIEN